MRGNGQNSVVEPRLEARLLYVYFGWVPERGWDDSENGSEDKKGGYNEKSRIYLPEICEDSADILNRKNLSLGISHQERLSRETRFRLGVDFQIHECFCETFLLVIGRERHV
jgi:hypothetical protein